MYVGDAVVTLWCSGLPETSWRGRVGWVLDGSKYCLRETVGCPQVPYLPLVMGYRISRQGGAIACRFRRVGHESWVSHGQKLASGVRNAFIAPLRHGGWGYVAHRSNPVGAAKGVNQF